MKKQKKTRVYEVEMTVNLGIFDMDDKEAMEAAAIEMACLLRCACLLLTAIQPFRKGGGYMVAGKTLETKKLIHVDRTTSSELLEGIKTTSYKKLLEDPEVFQQFASACRAVEELKDGT